MSNTVLAWNNYITSASLVAGSAAASLPVQNLQNDIGSASTGWQTAAGVITNAAGAWFRATPATPAQTWRALGIFRCNLTPAATVTLELWNSAGPTLVSSVAAQVVAGYGQAVAILPADTTADYCEVHIDDPTNPDGFVNVALAYGGPAWLPATGASWDTTVGRDDSVTETVSRGGQEYPVLLWQRRRWDLALDGIRQSELWADIGELDRISRAGGNVLFVPDQTSSTMQQEAVFGRLQSTADVTFPYSGADRRAWRASITERL